MFTAKLTENNCFSIKWNWFFDVYDECQQQNIIDSQENWIKIQKNSQKNLQKKKATEGNATRISNCAKYECKDAN